MQQEVSHCAQGPEAPVVRYHHVAIQTRDLDNALAWYSEFLGGQITWELATFADMTKQRLPGIQRLAEIRAGDMRLHLFERGPCSMPSLQTAQFNHLCLSVGDVAALRAYQARWHAVHETGRYTFAVDEPPTEILVDDSGIHSFYAVDTDGLELEFTYVPS